VTAPLPYVGISGLTTRTEVLAARSVFPACGRQLMVGVLASEKTLAGQQNRWHRRYPRIESIAGIFSDDPRCLNLVHFGADTPPDAATLLRLFELAGHRCHGFQFNGAWPYRSDLFRLHEAAAHRGRDLRVVLQCRCAGPSDLVWLTVPSVAHYGGAITDVLADASGGTGKPLERHHVDAWRQNVAKIWRDRPLGIGIAGGLCAEAIPGVADLLRAGASCDAEGRLRDDADGGGRLVQEKVEAYLEAAGEAATSTPTP
jgi:hypothetical protein